MPFGRPSTGDPAIGNTEFLDLIASASSESNDLDWALLDANYPARDLGSIRGGTGYTPREGNSPGTHELFEGVMNVNEGQDHESPRIHLDSNHVSPAHKAVLSHMSLHNSLLGQSPSELRIQDSAAESLLQLALTPRDTPEPELRPVDSHTLTEIKQEEPSIRSTSYLQPRSSHPSHIAGDPWPLSYRPTLGSDDILPSLTPRGFRSRGNSPQLIAHSVALVPRVTQSTRARILEDVLEISKGYLPFERSDRFVPRVETLDLFVQLFFEKAESFLPLIHRPTFDPNECPSFLTIALASIGARYAGELVMGAGMYAQALSETSRRMTQLVVSSDSSIMTSLYFCL